MKKIIILLVFSLYITNIFAQNFSGGLFIGPAISWVSTDSRIIDRDKIKLGYTFGATADLRIFDNFDLALGLKFNNIGGSIKFLHGATGLKAEEITLPDTLPPGSAMNFNLDYIAVPIGFKGKTNEIGHTTYFLKGGATPMVNIKKKGDISTFSDLIIKDHVNTLNFAWHIGGGFEYALAGSTRLLVELIYTGGLMDFSKFKDKDKNDLIFANDERSKTGDPKTTINDISLKVGILF